MNKLLIFLFIVLQTGVSKAQELRATVKVLSPEVQATNKDVFIALETSLQNFMNGYTFTEHKYADEERIACSFILTIEEIGRASCRERV